MDEPFSPAPPGFPRHFGAYLLLSPIAQGGMGDVFLASTLGISGAVRLVVIKTLRQDLVTEPGYLNRFLDEARIVIQLEHQNLSRVYDVGCVEGTNFFAMEHILGTNLRRLLDIIGREKKKIPIPLALLIGAQILEGLDYAHGQKHKLTDEPLRVVHRDISPHNVMISVQGDVKVIDFGLAASVLKIEQTETQVVLGKIAYMSPEQARGDEVDHRTDQFSAAVLLYEMLTGQRYYGSRVQMEIWALAGRSGFAPEHLDTIDPDIAALIRKAIQSDREDRIRTCGAFASGLKRILMDRFPDADKEALSEFVRDSASLEVETSERTVRALSALALTAVPDIATPRAVVPIPVQPPTENLTTATVSTLTGSKKRPRRMLNAASAAGIVVLAVLAGSLWFTRETPELDATAENPPPSGGASPSSWASPVVVKDPVIQPPPVVPVEVAPVEAAPVERTPIADKPPRVEKPVEKPPEKKPPEKPLNTKLPRWVRESWSTERKLKAVSACTDGCAKSARSSFDKGGIDKVLPQILDTCLETCGVR